MDQRTDQYGKVWSRVTVTQNKKKKNRINIVAKALDGQRCPLPLCEYMLCHCERGSGSKGADDLCLVIFEDLGLKVSINNEI